MNQYYWKKQSKDTCCCGQIAVSIILHKTLKETIKLFGHSSYTETKDLIKVLKSNKTKCGNKLGRKRPVLGIAKLTYPDDKDWHWVVIWGDKIFDGYNGKKNGTVKWKKQWRMTSFLKIDHISENKRRWDADKKNQRM